MYIYSIEYSGKLTLLFPFFLSLYVCTVLYYSRRNVTRHVPDVIGQNSGLVQHPMMGF